jgi:hypothetical protein
MKLDLARHVNEPIKEEGKNIPEKGVLYGHGIRCIVLVRGLVPS